MGTEVARLHSTVCVSTKAATTSHLAIFGSITLIGAPTKLAQQLPPASNGTTGSLSTSLRAIIAGTGVFTRSSCPAAGVENASFGILPSRTFKARVESSWVTEMAGKSTAMYFFGVFTRGARRITGRLEHGLRRMDMP